MHRATPDTKTTSWKLFLFVGLLLFFIVNLLQAVFTEINADEAYYFLYGEHLDWGDFDHPPMVGLMTFVSNALFDGNLSVRFVTVLLSLLTGIVLWKSLDETRPDKHKVWVFLTLLFSVVMFNIYGFITTPDSALLFFSALFFLEYKRYLKDNNLKTSLWISVLMAAMIYSKYHALLLLALVVLSNLSLLKDKRFWLSCAVTALLLVPHLVWQVENDFPSFKYHLMQRSTPFQWSFLLEYLPNQLLVFNPFTFGAMVYVLFRYKPDDRFERALFFSIVGFLVFFAFMTFRGHVEPHWTMVCMIPTILLLYKHTLNDPKLLRYTKHFILPSLLLIVAMRVLLLTPLSSRFGFYGNKAYYQAIEKVAEDLPVVFNSSYQEPSLYHYHTGKATSTLRSAWLRTTQYDLLQMDRDFIGRPVFLCAPWGQSQEFHVDDTVFHGLFANHYLAANRLNINAKIAGFDSKTPAVFHYGDTIAVDFSIENTLDTVIPFTDNNFSILLYALYENGYKFRECHHETITEIKGKSVVNGRLWTLVDPKIPAGKQRFTICIGDVYTFYDNDACYYDTFIEESTAH